MPRSSSTGATWGGPRKPVSSFWRDRALQRGPRPPEPGRFHHGFSGTLWGEIRQARGGPETGQCLGPRWITRGAAQRAVGAAGGVYSTPAATRPAGPRPRPDYRRHGAARRQSGRLRPLSRWGGAPRTTDSG